MLNCIKPQKAKDKDNIIKITGEQCQVFTGAWQ